MLGGFLPSFGRHSKDIRLAKGTLYCIIPSKLYIFVL
jgi:hypothetical protein